MTIPTVDMPLLVSASALLTLCLLLSGISQYLRQRTAKRKLIEKIQQDDEHWEGLGVESPSSKTDSVVQTPVLNFLNSLGKRMAPDTTSTEYSRMRIKFLRAGLRRPNILSMFWGGKIFLAVFLPLCFFVIRISVFRLFNPLATVAICFFLTALGFYLPDIWLGLRTAVRKNKILEGIPDALDLLVVCVEAGMGLDAAIKRVGDEMELTSKVLSDELKLLNMEMNVGKSRQDALRNLAIRTDLEDMNSLVTLLIQTEKFGTDIVKALRVYSDSFRTKRYQKAEEIASKIPVKLIFPLVFFIFPALFVTILGPAAIRMYQTFLQ
jgi:tight adherence protein C